MNRTELEEKVMAESGLTRPVAAKTVKTVFDLIAAQLQAGEEVKLTGFGTFSVKQMQARTAKNPQTGEEVHVAARRKPVFRPSSRLKDSL